MENLSYMKGCIKKSRFKIKIIDCLLLIIILIGIFGWGYKIIRHIYSNQEIRKFDIFILLGLGILLLSLLLYVNTIRKIIFTNTKIKVIGLFTPFGKEYLLENYKAKYIIEEYGSEGGYKVLYLVDKQGYTGLKIMGLHYKNMDEIIENINLPTIKKHLSFKESMKLLFTGKVKL